MDAENHDEIRLIRDYIANEEYLLDDKGRSGGLEKGESFIVLGDLNADPNDGDSKPGAVEQLLQHQRLHPGCMDPEIIPSSTGGKEHNQRDGDTGDPAFDTSQFGLRIDYVLPSSNLNITGSGVFWPSVRESGYRFIADEVASDHYLVWLDLIIQ